MLYSLYYTHDIRTTLTVSSHLLAVPPPSPPTHRAGCQGHHRPCTPNPHPLTLTLTLTQGAKAIIKQAVEEYKQTNALGGGELALLDKLLANLGTAAPPAQPFGGMPPGGTPAGGPPAPTDLTDEVSDAP